MIKADHTEKLSLFWVLQISGWLVYGIIYYLLYYSNKDLATVDLIGFSVTYLVAFLVTIVMRKIYQTMDYKKRSMLNVSIVVVLSSIIFAVIWLYLDRLISYPIYGIEKFHNALAKMTWRTNLSQIYWNAFILFTWSTLYFLINFWRQLNEQLLRAEKAELLAHSAQLQMLRYQLNPHFLFNSLNSIRALIMEDQNKARDMITELAELLRYSLVSKNNGDVALSDEMDAIRHYFAIEKKRFEENLEIEFDINPLAEEYPIPSFLVHPLVENAVKFGMKSSKMPLKITISAAVIGEDLTIVVKNSGKWVSPDDPSRSRPAGTGTGLNNVQQRLENRFPGSASLKTEEVDDCVVVTLKILRSIGDNHG